MPAKKAPAAASSSKATAGKGTPPQAEPTVETPVEKRGRGRFELPTPRGTAIYEGEWLEITVERPVPKDEGGGDGESEMHSVVIKTQDGLGKLSYSDFNESFEGKWKLGCMWSGKYCFPDGSTYEGEFLGKATFNGKGVLFFANGNKYEGAWQDGEMHGHGQLEARSTASTSQPATWSGLFEKGSFKCGSGAAFSLNTPAKSLPPTVRFLLEEKEP